MPFNIRHIVLSAARLIKRLYIFSQGDAWYLQKAIRQGLRIGEDCRIYTVALGGEPYLVSIGNHVTLSKDVELITHDGGVWVFRDKYPDLDVLNRIDIGNNIFVGAKSIILPGTRIHDNVVVGAGSLVKGVLESDWVYAGVPAKKIKPLGDYLQSALRNGINSKNVDPEEKRRIFERTFESNDT